MSGKGIGERTPLSQNRDYRSYSSTEIPGSSVSLNIPQESQSPQTNLQDGPKPITYSWKNVSMWSDAEPKSDKKFKWRFFGNGQNGGTVKQILNNVTGIARPGKLFAIMGASGAGKTSLLNVLTCRSGGNKVRTSGSLAINGISTTPEILSSISAYVQQDDMFIGTLTVREHLIFHAMVRMHTNLTYLQRVARVQDVIKEFGLTKCADTLIGIPGRLKGISGGEMKRLSFASEVLTDCQLVFADEPTSGLDSYMAQNVVEVLKEMAMKGKTIICTVHQPASELFSLFDTLLLLSEGKTAYLGDAGEAITFFNGCGYSCPLNFNPADFFIETLAMQPDSEENCQKRINKICNLYEKSITASDVKELVTNNESKSVDASQIHSSLKKHSPYKASWCAQFRAVLWRSWLSLLKEPLILQARGIQTVVIAILLGIVFFGQKLNQEGIVNINGALFLLLTNMTFQNVFSVINVFSQELPIFLREHFNGMYRTDVYFLAKTLAEVPFFTINPILFTAICYPMIGLNGNWEKFFITCLIVVLVASVAASFGYFISCISGSTPMAMSIVSPFIVVFMLLGGFFLNKGSIPGYLLWVKNLSWFMYGNEALVVNQWEDIVAIECNTPNSTCSDSGEVVLKTLRFDKTNLYPDIACLLFLVILYRLLAYAALLSKTYRKNRNIKNTS